MSLVVIDNDPWLMEYELCGKLHKEIVDLLNKRSVKLKWSDDYARLSSAIRIRLKQFDTEVQQLAAKLKEFALSRTITFDEAERRQRMVENLKTQSIQSQMRFNERDEMSRTNRNELMGQNFPYTQKQRYDDDDDPLLETPNFENIAQIRNQQLQIKRDQDAGLEELYKSITRQKTIAIKIGDEVDVQNEIIDDISNTMERTATGLQRGTNQIQIVSRKDSTCCCIIMSTNLSMDNSVFSYWVIIISLMVAILVVAFI